MLVDTIVAMKSHLTGLITMVLCAVICVGENKGTCPPSPPVGRHRTNPSAQSGKIRLQAVVSDTGYVCSARVIDQIDKKSDAEAESVVRKWHFPPAKKDGRAVPVVVIVEVPYERDKGNIVFLPHPPTPSDNTAR